jgi:hypothetical protein
MLVLNGAIEACTGYRHFWFAAVSETLMLDVLMNLCS